MIVLLAFFFSMSYILLTMWCINITYELSFKYVKNKLFTIEKYFVNLLNIHWKKYNDLNNQTY